MIGVDELNPSDWEVNKSIIKVIGVGGGGSNAVTQMFKQGIKDVSFLICNTDLQALRKSDVPDKLQLGTSLTQGLGAGCNPEQGRHAALESIDKIEEKLNDGTKMVFITAGMGGGTGTGATPVIAEIAKRKGILTIGVVTLPFRDECTATLKRAVDGIKELEKHVDSLLIIDNQKIYEIYDDLPISEAFPKVDGVLSTAVKGIAEIITRDGYVNVDFADVKTTMQNSGMALMGIGVASGENRGIEAVKQAFFSPLLNNLDLKSTRRGLINITSSSKNSLEVFELEQIMDYIKSYIGNAENLKRGIVFDDSAGDTISVTVIAAGCKRADLPIIHDDDVTSVEKIILKTYEGEEVDIYGDLKSSDYTEPESFSMEDITIYDSISSISKYESEPAITRWEKSLERKKRGDSANGGMTVDEL